MPTLHRTWCLALAFALTAGPSVQAQTPPAGALLRLRPSGTSAALLAVAFTPDGQAVATADRDGAVRLWDTATGYERRRFAGLKRAARGIAFADMGRLLTAAGDDGVIVFWDAVTGAERRRLQGPGGAVHALTCSADGKLLAAAGAEGEVRLWDAVTGAEVRRLVRTSRLDALAFAPDGKTLATGGRDRTIRLWNIAAGRETARFRTHAWVLTLAFAADGKTLAAGGRDQVIHLWALPDGKRLPPRGGNTGPLHAVALSDNGAAAHGAGEDGLVRLWASGTTKPQRMLAGHRGPINALALAPNGRLLVSAGADGTALVWDLNGPELLWLDLGSADEAFARDAIGRLAADSAAALALLRRRMRPLLAEARRIDMLLVDLGSEQYAARAHANVELAKIGPRAEAPLRLALAGYGSLELRRRIEALLARLPGRAPDETGSWALRLLRGVEVLERIGTPAACELLTELTRGPESAPVTRAARAALRRLHPLKNGV